MARFHVQETVEDTEDNPLDGATVSVCVLGTTELSREPLYADDSSATLLANPLTSDGSGVVDFYLANPLACDLVPVKAGVAGQTVTVRPGRPAVGDVPTWDGQQDVHQAPSGGGSGGWQRVSGAPFVATGAETEHTFTIPADTARVSVSAVLVQPAGTAVFDLAAAGNDADAFDQIIGSVNTGPDGGSQAGSLEVYGADQASVAFITRGGGNVSVTGGGSGPVTALRLYSNDGITPFGAGTWIDVLVFTNA